jgi:pimeloyl-ACP methyl ester carboxylesterase
MTAANDPSHGATPEGVVLPHDDSGHGEPALVFLHALGGSPEQWAFQVRHLRGSHRCIALTLRGHGTAPSPGSFTIEAMAADIADTLAALNVHRAVLVGHSSGAHVALAYAVAHPLRVMGLLLADPAGDARKVPRDMSQAMLHALDTDATYTATIENYYRTLLVGSHPEVAAGVIGDLQATARATIRGVFHAAMHFDPVAALAAYKGPVLAVDSYLGDQPLSLARLVPTLRTARIGDTGHWLQLDQPKKFNEIVDGFLEKLAEGDRM